MKKSALFTAAVPAVFSVALSLSMLACSDDAPAVAPVLGGGEIASSDSDPFNSSSSVSGKGQSSFHLGACKRNALDVLAKDASVGETRKAYLVNDSAGTHVVLPDVDDYCGYYGEVTYSKELSGDTLIVVKNMKRALPTNCRCIYDFRIDLDVIDLCAKFVRYGNVYEIVTEPLPESSSSVKPLSSASVESSSATAPASSESVTPQSIPFLATCVNDVVYVDDPLSKSSDVAPPSAYKFYTPAGIPVLTLKGSYFEIPCDKKQAESFMSGLNSGDKSVASFAYLVSGDTLYARVSRSKGFSYGCSCAAEVSFGFEEGGTYIQYVSFEHNEVIPAPELHYVIAPSSSSEFPMSSATVASSSSAVVAPAHQVATDVAGYCIERDPSENRFDLNEGIGDYAIPPVAYMEPGSDSVTFILERARFACGASFVNLDVSTSGDTVVVKPNVALANGQSDDCICPTRLTFNVKAEDAFTNAKVLVVDDGKNAFNKMRIVKYDEMKYYVSSNILDRDGYTRGKCLETETAPAANPEATLIIYQDGRSLMEIDHVKDYCDIDAKISQKVVGDTLFLDYDNTSAVSECFCTFQTHKFVIDLDKTGAKYVKFRSVVYRIVGVTYTKVPNWEL